MRTPERRETPSATRNESATETARESRDVETNDDNARESDMQWTRLDWNKLILVDSDGRVRARITRGDVWQLWRYEGEEFVTLSNAQRFVERKLWRK